MNDLSNNIKKVMIVFLLLFVALITYLTIFFVVKGPEVVNTPLNKRLWAKRNEVTRGTIFDRNMQPLSVSSKVEGSSQKREYKGGAMFAHALGYMDVKYGLTGLENRYDNELMANNSLSYMELLKLFKNKGKEKEKIGNSLKVTLDYEIQKAAYDLLGDNKGSVVALNPKTGEILAMVSKPSYDPNNLNEIWSSLVSDKENVPLLNRAVSGLYPPGSVFKVVTAVSALENIKDIENRIFKDEGKIVFNEKYSLSNYGGSAYGNISLKDGFIKSSNVVFGTLAMELGNDKLKATAEKFFFNKEVPKDGIVIDNSKFPDIPKTEKGNIAQSGIGQSSILASPMEMALVASTVANNGVMMSPMIVNQILTYEGEKIRSIEPKVAATVTTPQIAGILKDYMKDVVSKGTGKNAAVAGINVAGKTGTADHDSNGNSEPHSWFIGFAPYEDPQIAFAVIVEDGGTGGSVAAKIASGVVKTALKK
jgi:peptidoglycan glycosyltransferase